MISILVLIGSLALVSLTAYMVFFKKTLKYIRPLIFWSGISLINYVIAFGNVDPSTLTALYAMLIGAFVTMWIYHFGRKL